MECVCSVLVSFATLTPLVDFLVQFRRDVAVHGPKSDLDPNPRPLRVKPPPIDA